MKKKQVKEKCPICKGLGVINGSKCRICDGSGKIVVDVWE